MTDPQPAVPLDRLLAHRAWVRALARRLVTDESRADDIEQETWLAAMQHPPRRDTSLRAWLSAVVRNAARKGRRGAVRRARHETAAAAPGPARDGADLVAEAELNQFVVRAVLELEEPYRTTVLLRWFDGLPPRDIAARTSVPVETVRTRLKRAHERLRETLDGRFGGDRRAWVLLMLRWPEPSAPLPDVPPGATGSPAPSAVPVGAGASGSLAGVLAMSALKKTVAALVVVTLLAAAAWQVAEPLGSAGDDTATDVEVAGDTGAVHRAAARAARAGTSHASPVESAVHGAPAADAGVVELLVRTSSGAPIDGATVEAHPPLAAGVTLTAAQASAWYAAAPVPSATARTGPDGVARLRGVPLDRVTRIVARKPGFVPAGTWAQPRDASTPTRAEVLLVTGHALVGRVVTAARKPVAGALVLAGGPAERWNANSGASPLVSRTRTGDDGSFAFADLARGEVILWAAFPDGPAVQVAVLLVPALREVELVLPATVTVSGAVRDAETKEPIAGALVSVRGSTVDSVVTASALTDADGVYRVASFPADGGNLDAVEVRADGFVASDPYERASVALRPGTDVVVDRTLRRAGILTGAVRGEGAPIAGAIVTAAWPGDAVARTTRTRTDASGRYRFTDTARGRVTVVVSAEGWFQQGFAALWKRSVQDGAAPAISTVEVPAKGEAVLDVDLSRGRIVTGRVSLPGGSPAADALVSASVADTWDFDGPWRTQTARSAADGTFRIAGVAPAPRAVVSASLAGLASSEAASVPLPADGDPGPIELRLRETVGVRGVVTVAAAADAGDVWVEWTRSAVADDVSQDPSIWSSANRVPVDGERRFEIAGRSPGQALSIRAASTRLPASRSVRATPEVASAGPEISLALSPGRSALGRILDRDAGTPLAGARVRLVALGSLPNDVKVGRPEPLAALVAVTTASGEFVLRDLTDGTYEIRADAPGHLPGSRRFDVPIGSAIDLALAPARVLSGRAVLPDGAPAAGVLVALSPPDHTTRSTTADADGSFSFADVGDGPFMLWFSSPFGVRETGANVRSRTLRDVRPGGEPLVVVLETGLAIAGRVVDARGAGVSRIWVQATNETPGAAGAGEPMSVSDWSESDGSFIVRGLRPGRHTLLAAALAVGRAGAGAPAAGAGTPGVQHGVEAGAAGVVLTLGAGLSIDGTVVVADRRALSRMTIQAGPEDERSMRYDVVMGASADVAENGRFRIEGLQPGRYRLRLLADGSRPSALQFADAEAVVEAGATGLRLTASSATTISGRVTLGPDSALFNVPVNAVRVGDDKDTLHGTSGLDGGFVLLGAKPGARYDLRTSLLGIVQGHARGVASGAADVRLQCEKGRTARGRAVDARGEPAAKVLLWFTADGEESTSSATTDAEGRFEVRGLTDAEHRVRFEAFVAQPDGTRKREWRDCGTVRAGDDGVVLRVTE